MGQGIRATGGPTRQRSRALVNCALAALGLGIGCTRVVEDGSESFDTSDEMPSDSGQASPEAGSPDTQQPDSGSGDENSLCRGHGLHCAASPPKGWFGPLQLQKIEYGRAALACEAALPKRLVVQDDVSSAMDEVVSPSLKDNLFVDQVSAAAARCSGCKSKFEEGKCAPPRWSLRNLDPTTPSGCGREELQDGGDEIESAECRTHELRSSAGQGWALLPPKVAVKARCEAVVDDVVQEIDPVKFGQFYRSCKVSPSKQRCSSKGDTCLRAKAGAPWMNRICIGKMGEHQCAASDFPMRLVTFAEVSDDRGCSKCSASMQGTTERCDTNIYVQFNDEDECRSKKQVDPIEICVESLRFVSLKPITATRDEIKYFFDGECRPVFESRGEVKARKPVTFCCQNPNDLSLIE